MFVFMCQVFVIQGMHEIGTVYISWNEQNTIGHVIMILQNYGTRGHIILK